MSKNALSPQEKKLGKLLKGINKEKDFVIPVVLLACELGAVNECIDYIESNPDSDDQDVIEFLTKDLPPMEIVDEDDET